jgi:hypothetical protein
LAFQRLYFQNLCLLVFFKQPDAREDHRGGASREGPKLESGIALG